MKYLLLTFILFPLINTTAQINLNDSTVQAIGYWDKNEKQSYNITYEKYKVKDADTTSREFYKYTVDITIVDSTANSYTIDWFYKDYEANTSNKILNKVLATCSDMSVRIKTNELGAFQEVVNWQEVRDYIYKNTKALKKEFKDIPNMQQFISQMEDMYSTKASIESGAIKDILQFYTYHGAQYAYGQQYEADMKVGNLYGGDPFDAKVTVWLYDINSDDNNFTLCMKQIVDSVQLTNVTFDYLTKMSKTLKVTVPKKEEMPMVTNNTYNTSQIHGSGWVVYSIETKETEADGHLGVEERVIEIK